MTLTLKLPKELEKALFAKATEKGLSLPEFALQILDTVARPKTGKELVVLLKKEGIIGCRPDIKDSLKYARKLRQKASRRNR